MDHSDNLTYIIQHIKLLFENSSIKPMVCRLVGIFVDYSIWIIFHCTISIQEWLHVDEMGDSDREQCYEFNTLCIKALKVMSYFILICIGAWYFVNTPYPVCSKSGTGDFQEQWGTLLFLEKWKIPPLWLLVILKPALFLSMTPILREHWLRPSAAKRLCWCLGPLW